MPAGQDELIRHVAALAADTADELVALSKPSGASRPSAVAEAQERFLGSKRVSQDLDPDDLDDAGLDTLRRLAAVRRVGELRSVLTRRGREMALQLHRSHGMTGQRLAEALGVSNATVSAWIREDNAVNAYKENHG